MKNLKKILMALVLVAVIISSVVIVAIADVSYTGKVSDVQQLLGKVDEAETLAEKSTALANVYSYLTDTPVAPDASGYDEIIEEYNDLTFKVAYKLFMQLSPSASADMRAEKVKAVYIHLASAPVFDADSDLKIALGFKCACGAIYTYIDDDFFAGLRADPVCPNGCAGEAKVLVPYNEYSYSDFEKALNDAALDVAAPLVDKLFGNTSGNYYELIASQKAVENFLKDVLEISYSAPSSTLYTGSVAAAEAKLELVKKATDLEGLKSGLADLYAYLVATPVNPTEDAYTEFITEYYALCEKLTEGFEQAVADAEKPADKLAVLVSYRTYLMGDGTNGGSQLSASTVEAYNDLRTKLADEFKENGDSIAQLPELSITLPEATYATAEAYEQFVEKITLIESLPEKDAVKAFLVPELYELAANNVFDPTTEGYASVVERYNAICLSYVNNKYVAEIDAAVEIADKYSVLASFCDFVTAYPLSENVISVYNTEREELLALAKKLASTLGVRELPTYSPEQAGTVTTTSTVLNSFLSNLEASYVKYTGAEPEDKAAALDALKKSASDMYTYILGAVMDTEADYYSSFVERYNTARNNVADVLMATVDAAESAEAKLEALSAIREYLVKTPLSKYAVSAYNAKVGETVTDATAAEAMKLDHVYITADRLAAAITDAGATVEEILANGILLQNCTKSALDITDPAYAEYLAAYETATAVIGDVVYGEVIYAVWNLTPEETSATVSEYLDYIEKVPAKSIIQGFRTAVKSVTDICDGIINKVEGNHSEITCPETVYAEIRELTASFDAATELKDEMDVFKKLYGLMFSLNGNVAFTSADAYDGVMADYARITQKFEADVVASMDAQLAPVALCENMMAVYNYLTALPFSETLETAYGAARDAAIARDFASYAAQLETDCPTAVYTVPEGFTPNLARVIIALNLSVDGEPDFDKFDVAYKILCGLAGAEEGAQVIDFGEADFLAVIKQFDSTKTKISALYEAKISAAATADEKCEILAELGQYLKDHPFSLKMIEYYGEIRDDIYDYYISTSKSVFTSYQKMSSTLHDFLDVCSINTKLLDDYGKIKYNNYKTLIQAIEYGELNAYINSFNNSGSNALVDQMSASNALDNYVSKYNLSSVKDSATAAASLFAAFDKVLDSLDEEGVKLLGASIQKGYPKELVNAFNAKFGTSYTAAPSDTGTGTGTLEEFSKYIISFEAQTDYSGRMSVIKSMVAYLAENPLSNDNLYENVSSLLDEISEEVDRLVEEAKAEIDKNAPLTEYELPIYQDYDHQDGKIYTATLAPSSDTSKRYHTVETEANGNKYAKLEVTTSASPYFDMAVKDDSKGLVIDMDIMSPGDLNFNFAFTENGINTGNRVTTWVLQFQNNQLLYKFNVQNSSKSATEFPNYRQGVDEPITATPGAWMHITIVLDTVNKTEELIINYKSLGKKEYIVGYDDECKFTMLRFQCNKTESILCYDNVKVYGGTSYRILDKFDNMSAEDKFNFYVDYALNSEYTPSNRMYAYNQAIAMISTVGSACDENKEKISNFDSSQIRADAETAHIEKITELMSNVDLDEMNSENVATMGAAIDKIAEYIEENRQSIDQSNPVLIAANALVNEGGVKKVWLENLALYVENLTRFHRATTLASMKRHLEAAETYYKLCELNKASYAATAELDPVVIAFTESVSAAGDMTLKSYYDEYVPARMTERLNYENSNKILECIEFIELIVSNKDELTEEEYQSALLVAAKERADYVDPYLTAIRSIVNSKAYDEDVEGIDEALVIFELLDDLFFDIIQSEHFAVIKAKLDRFTVADSYIEKAGICTFVENYINDNDVDMTTALGVQYLYTLSVYKAELVSYKIDYEAILEENTKLFIGIVQKMDAYVNYADLKPLYEEALNNYYYSMNVDSDEAKAAVEKFAAYQATIERQEADGAIFVGYVNALKDARRQAQIYRALVRCAAYADIVDTGVSGVAKALETYNAKLAEYNASIEPQNSEISEVADAVCALRSNSIAATVLAVIKNIFSK